MSIWPYLGTLLLANLVSLPLLVLMEYIWNGHASVTLAALVVLLVVDFIYLSAFAWAVLLSSWGVI